MISFFHMVLSFASTVSFSIESLLRGDLMLWCCSVFLMSLVMRASQVACGWPTGRLRGTMWNWSAFCAGVSGCSLRTWPKSAIRLFLILSLMGVSLVRMYRFLLEIFFGYLMLMAILRILR